MIYLFVNLKEPFVNPSKTNNQCHQSRSCSLPSCAQLSRFVCKELHHLILVMIAQIVEHLVYVHCLIHIFLQSYDIYFLFVSKHIRFPLGHGRLCSVSFVEGFRLYSPLIHFSYAKFFVTFYSH